MFEGLLDAFSMEEVIDHKGRPKTGAAIASFAAKSAIEIPSSVPRVSTL